MVGKIVVTYKRKKLPSKSEACHKHNSEVGSSKELSEEKGSSTTISTLTFNQGDNNLRKNHLNSFRDDPSYKRRLSLPLLTFARRSVKKKTADDLKDNGGLNQEKNSSEDIDSSLLSTSGADEARPFSGQTIGGCPPLSSSVEADINPSDSSVTKRTPSYRGIDCNLPPEPDEDTPALDVEEALGPRNLVSEKSPALLQLEAAENRSSTTMPFVVDKGKSAMDSPQLSCLQLFPLSRSEERLHTLNDSPNFPDAPFRSRAYDTSLPKSGTINNDDSFSDTLVGPTHSGWSEDELDCLWIGVRRHGSGNWDAMLRDRRLRASFSPWRTALDLARRWLVEQSRLVRGSRSPFDGYGAYVSRRPSPTNPRILSVPYSYFGKEMNSNPYGPPPGTGCGCGYGPTRFVSGLDIVKARGAKADERPNVAVVLSSDTSSEGTVSDDLSSVRA